MRLTTIDEADAPRLRWEVVDTGIGIPAAKRDRLFRSFSQAGHVHDPHVTAAPGWAWPSAASWSS